MAANRLMSETGTMASCCSEPILTIDITGDFMEVIRPHSIEGATISCPKFPHLPKSRTSCRYQVLQNEKIIRQITPKIDTTKYFLINNLHDQK